MRILHTADWHLADRLRHVDRTGDLQRAAERVADYCRSERADVLAIAGDLFSDLIRPERFQVSVAHLSELFRPFLLRGGTIVAVTGNHDSDVYCETLRRAFQLAAPMNVRPGDLLPPGRLYLAVRPVHFQLADRREKRVQFVCMPYPTASRYDAADRRGYVGLKERSRLLERAYVTKLECIRRQLAPGVPRVLATHINTAGSAGVELFRQSYQEDVVLSDEASMRGWAYAALGHLHRPQSVGGQSHVRYAGAIDRLDMGERNDRKGVVLAEVGEKGLAGEPVVLPLEATPFYDVRIRNPRREIPRLADRYPRAAAALVRCRISYRPGEDDLHAILADVARIFPRCYERTWSVARAPARPDRSTPPRVEAGGEGATAVIERRRPIEEEASPLLEGDRVLADIVLDYLQRRLAGDPDRDELLETARRLMGEED